MTERALDVWCFGALAGRLIDAPSGLAFSYAPGWMADGRPPLSQSLPLDGSAQAHAAEAFFGGLLPEGTPRAEVARTLGLSATNDFGLLAALAGDTAGAVSLHPAGSPPASAAGDVAWLSDGELADIIAALPARPMRAGTDGEFRLSLAGAQDKLPVVADADGRIGLTRGGTPSTHILKAPIARLPNTVLNEAFCLSLGRALGLKVAAASPRRVGEQEFLLVERYDRRGTSGGVERLHQEDLCQALGVPSSRKYEAEGGPSLVDCFAMVRQASAVPAVQVLALLDITVLSLLVGNHDAHGKNHSLLYLPGSRQATLAPGYDILSTALYERTHGLARKMAMAIGGEYRPAYLRSRHLDRLVEAAGLSAPLTRRRVRQLAEAAPGAARAARAAYAADGWDQPVLGELIAMVDQRAQLVAALTVG